MSNNSYLIACDQRSPSPTLALKRQQHEIFAEGVWRVPPLWMSLFRESDLVGWTWSVDDDSEFLLHSPVVSRRRIASRIREAKEALARLKSVDYACLCDLLDAFKSCIDSLNARRKYIVCEWQEVAGLDPKRHEREMNWLLRFYSGDAARSVDRHFESLCGVKLSQRFQNPTTTSSSDYSERSWQTLDALLGDTLADDAPWHPQLLQMEEYSSIASAMHHDDVPAIARMLAAGTRVEPGNVQSAARGHNPELLRLLLEHGGDPNETFQRHGAPLVKAFNSFSKKSVKDAKLRLLLDHGANPNVTGGQPATVLCCCFRHGMNFAEEIISKTKKTVVRRFLSFADSDEGRQFVRDCGIKWRTKFLNVARKRLAS